MVVVDSIWLQKGIVISNRMFVKVKENGTGTSTITA